MFTKQTSISSLSNSSVLVEQLLKKGKEVGKGKSLLEAGIIPKWMRTYRVIERRCRDDKDFGLTGYPYEQGPNIVALNLGFFEHRDWPLRRAVELYHSMRPVFEYEANYFNAAGYWMEFSEVAISLGHDALENEKDQDALLFDVWSQISVRYGLRMTGLRCQLYRLVACDPTYAKLVMPSLEQRHELHPADDFC